MKKNIKKLIAIGLISSSICMLPLTGASAEARWRNDGVGWWYMKDDGYYATGWIQTNGKWYYVGDSGYMKTGWQQDNGKWYYLNTDGSMATNTNIGGYQIGSDGVWVQNTTTNNTNSNNVINTNSNNTTNINNGVINNTNVTNNVYVNGNMPTATTPNGIGATPNSNISPNNIDTPDTKKISTIYNKTTNPYTNETVAKKQKFDGTNGFKQIADNLYVYYENGIMLNNCWKEFEDGIRYFDEHGYMVCNRNVDYIHLDSDGTVQLLTNQRLDKEENRKGYGGTVGCGLVQDYRDDNYSLEYIKYMCDIFDIPIKTQYQDVYNKSEDGKILKIKEKDGKIIHERSACDSITIYIGKYASRLDLN